MDLALRKDADDAPLLGPPRNAMLWMRAKQMAQAMGKMGDFQTILQVYQMLTLAPGFAAVSKSALRCKGMDWRALTDVSMACRTCLEKGRQAPALQEEAALWAEELRRQMAANARRAPRAPLRKASASSSHKYIKREMKQGEWVYTYPGDATHAASSVAETPASAAPAVTANADVAHIDHPKLNFDDRRAIGFYQGNGFEEFNNKLRDPEKRAGLLDTKQKGNPFPIYHKNLMAAIGKSRVNKPIAAFRGVSLPPALLKVGAVLSDGGFVSTTTSPKVAEGFAASSARRRGGQIPVVLSTILPKGTSALAVTHLSQSDEDGDYADEHEMLLPPKTSFKVVSSKVIKGIHHVQVEMVPPALSPAAQKRAPRVLQTPAQGAQKSSALTIDMAKANMGRKQPNGRRQGLWKWSKDKARRKGKPDAYAAGIARRVMGKSVAPLTAGLRLNASPHWDRMLQVATANVSNPEPRPSRRVAAISDVVSGLPLGPDAMAQLVIDLAEVVEQAQSPADAMRQAGVATQDHPELDGALRQEVASRIAFLHGMFAA